MKWGKKAKYIILTWWRRCVDLRIILYLKVAIGAKPSANSKISHSTRIPAVEVARVIIKTHCHFPLFLAAAPLGDCKKRRRPRVRMDPSFPKEGNVA